MEKIESYRFNGFSLWSEPKSKKTWWITNWTITKDGKEIYRLDNQGTLPSEVLRAWAKATKLKPLNEFNGQVGSYVYSFKGVQYVSDLVENSLVSTFVPLTDRLARLDRK